MKKLTLALLLTLSTQAFAQQNELVLAPAYVRYHAHHRNRGVFDVNGGGYQLSLTYLRNIKWLQIGGGVEAGKLNTVRDKAYQPIGRHTPGDPYVVFNALMNGRLVKIKWTFYGGACWGYMIASARDAYSYTGPLGYQKGEKYTISGFYKGGQIGASYQLRPKLAISADFTARFTRMQQPGIDTNNNFKEAPYDRLNLYNFSVGVHYKF